MRAKISFPISERAEKAVIGGVTYMVRLKGNTVVSIDPPGTNVPF